MTRRLHVDVPAPALGGAGTVIVHGHYGRPFLVFPSERGRAWDFENNGMVDAVRPLIDGGRCKLYCVTSHDADSWSNRSLSMEDRARRHAEYEQWIVDSVLPFLWGDCGGVTEVGTIGASMGAYHALTFALRRADLFPLSISMSGNYDPSSWHGWGEQGEAAYFTNPTHFDPGPGGAAPEWVRPRPRRRPPRVAALPAVCRARRRAGDVGGHHRRAAVQPAHGAHPAGEGHP